MAKKLKKAKKGMNPKVKFTLGCSFKGLISNQAVIDGSRGSAWWVAAIFLAFSTILPLVPTFAQLSRLNGNSFIAVNSFGLEEQLSHFVYTAKKTGQEFKVEGGNLSYYKNEVKQDFVDPNDEIKNPKYFDDRKCEYEYENIATHQIDLKVYFWVDTNIRSNIDKILTQTYRNNTSEKATPDDKYYYLPNIVIFTPTTMAVSLYKANTATIAATSNGGLDWHNTAEGGYGMIDRMIGATALKDLEDNPSMSESTFVNKYSKHVINEFRNICTETYLTQKSKTKWTNTGIYFGIYVGVVVFLGLMVFILTRGKRNPYNFLNIWECQKISWWAAASPAIIGTILSLIFSGNAIGQMAFILVVSLRVMWLSMKQLRPVVQ